MEQEFHKGRLAEKFGLNVLIPTETERAIVYRVIYDKLCQERFCRSHSKIKPLFDR